MKPITIDAQDALKNFHLEIEVTNKSKALRRIEVARFIVRYWIVPQVRLLSWLVGFGEPVTKDKEQ